MCGITGFSGTFSSELLMAMNERIAHRGPDDDGIWLEAESQVGLAHRRLSIIDLSPLGKQPMWDLSETLVIVFNGEIYNYRELRALLETKGHRFRSQSDTEVLLNLYLEQGVEMLHALNGIFAFALWDTRSKKLFIARDRLGVKPLYYCKLEKGVLFSSELKSLLLEPSLSRELDPFAIQAYLNHLWCPAPRTPLKAVRKLEPGCALLLERGEISREWRFWDQAYDQPISVASAETLVEELRDRLQTAVRRQMVSDVPLGAFLSGGLDSSAIAAMAQKELGGERLQCFTIGFRNQSCHGEGFVEDLHYAELVAKHLGVDLHKVEVGPEAASCVEEMVYQLDEPQGDPAPLNVLFISRLARERGIKVLLSGAGGDDIFSGYRRHEALLAERYWSWLPGLARKSLVQVTSQLSGASPFKRRFSRAFRYADLEGDARLASYFNWLDRDALTQLLSPALREEIRAHAQPSQLLLTLSRLGSEVPTLNRMLQLEIKHFLADHNLNYTDKMSMAVGLEVRVPLLDNDLLEFAARVPIAMKQRGRVGKWLFKKAMEPLLPHEVIYRPKTGFGMPLRHWLGNELRPMTDELLSQATLSKRGLFDPAKVAALLGKERSNQADATYPLFAMICVELWCRRFIDR